MIVDQIVVANGLVQSHDPKVQNWCHETFVVAKILSAQLSKQNGSPRYSGEAAPDVFTLRVCTGPNMVSSWSSPDETLIQTAYAEVLVALSSAPALPDMTCEDAS